VALWTNDMIGRVILVANRFEILEDGGSGDKRDVYFWTHHALETIAAIVPIQSVEL